jgi:WD40 repeat protein
MVAPPASALTEYRYEVIIAPLTPLDYKGVTWAADGSEATIVGGVQALLVYDADSRRAVASGDGNWSTSTRTLEDVVYAADGTQYIVGGVLDGSSVTGDLWQLLSEEVFLRGSIEGDALQAVAASPDGRVVAVGALGTVVEYVNGTLETLGNLDTVLYDAAWAPDGSGVLMVGAAGTIVWLDATTNELEDVGFTSTHPLYAVGWHPDSDIAWAVGEGGLVVEVTAGSLDTSRVRPYTPRTENLFGVAWHPEGNKALVVGEEGIAFLYRMGVFTQQRVDTNKYLLDVEWNPEGDEALVVGESGTLLRYAPKIEPQNREPSAVISSPAPGEVILENTTIVFDGSDSSDPDDDPLTYVWSNSTGQLGVGAIIERNIPQGDHTVTLSVDDGQGGSSNTSVTFKVVPPPPPSDRLHLTIDAPRPGSLLSGEVVVSGTSDFEMGKVLIVEVSVDGEGWRPADGTEEWTMTLDTRLMTDGLHSIEVKVTGDDELTAAEGVTKVESLLIEVRNAIVPEPPVIPNVTIRLRDHGAVDELLSFSAEGGNLSEWMLVWTFGDGASGHGQRVHHAYSAEGTYEVVLQLWLEGYTEPAATFTATVVIETAEEGGMSLMTMVLLSLVAVGLIYLAGYYGGRRAFRRD